ncbi:uncharacterized protein L969DRAFT_95149 [Mixia osmundae IAM 14324]|uniref:H/ACA ribonucleoprotein complex subunit NOP10 n=1 Tax=Mixia osmundae (strain CBS 9802 / IAM 14324 / JCM 22182 / KY 12970) TaxID=764103 RepID=G7E714_MIXOS|nr:uncharacterized protein L969DRAFT_95149 [Mixia osmundae IAM 14324]KEI38994.1 hypothetical protein L969DRAFT_95149 [Mixia osmundae IAM 14324]GAA98624.1 hypothetical protein E5Q_05311 [Mixia osmundae IAM 14324]
MHLMYSLDEAGNRRYTLKKRTDAGKLTRSAHPARFSPDDKCVLSTPSDDQEEAQRLAHPIACKTSLVKPGKNKQRKEEVGKVHADAL